MNAFIDLSDAEQVSQLVAYAGTLLKESGPEFVERLTQRLKTGAVATVLSELITVSPHLFFTGAKEAESTFNSISLILRTLKKDDAIPLAKELACAVSSDKVAGLEVPRMKILANLFNNLSKDSIARYFTYLELVRFAGRTNQLDLLIPQVLLYLAAYSRQFSQIREWLSDWHCTVPQEQDLYRLLSATLKSLGKTKLYMEYKCKLLSTFNGAAAADLELAKGDAIELLSTVFGDDDVFDLNALPALDAVKQLAGTPLHALLQILCAHDMTAYGAWVTANQANLSSFGFSEAAVSRKIRLLTLAALCSKSDTLDFATVAEALRVSKDDIESWVIDVIRAGLVEVKIDELNEKLFVSRSTYTDFGPAQWLEVQKRLQSWNQNLCEVQQVLDNVRLQMRPKASSS